jgi:hypothetical protein
MITFRIVIGSLIKNDTNVTLDCVEQLADSVRVAGKRADTDTFARMSGVVWTLLHGRPMTCFQQLGEFAACNEWGPWKGWSQSTGWRTVQGILSVVIDSTAKLLAEAPFLGFSLDESTDTAGAALLIQTY